MCVRFASPLEVVDYLHDGTPKKKDPVMIWTIYVLKYECCFL